VLGSEISRQYFEIRLYIIVFNFDAFESLRCRLASGPIADQRPRVVLGLDRAISESPWIQSASAFPEILP
jgi:hypothetical protein